MRTHFRNAPMIQHQNLIGFHNRGEPMRDDERGAVFGDLLELALDGFFRFRVEGGGSFVENQNVRIFQNRARNRYALFLAAREFQATLTYRGLVFIRQRFDKLMNMCVLRGLQDFFTGRIGPTISDVVIDRVVKQHSILRHDADGGAQAGLRHIADILAINQNAPAAHVIETK